MPGGKDSISGVCIRVLSSRNMLMIECSFSEDYSVNFMNCAKELNDFKVFLWLCDVRYAVSSCQRNVKVLCSGRCAGSSCEYQNRQEK